MLLHYRKTAPFNGKVFWQQAPFISYQGNIVDRSANWSQDRLQRKLIKLDSSHNKFFLYSTPVKKIPNIHASGTLFDNVEKAWFLQLITPVEKNTTTYASHTSFGNVQKAWFVLLILNGERVFLCSLDSLPRYTRLISRPEVCLPQRLLMGNAPVFPLFCFDLTEVPSAFLPCRTIIDDLISVGTSSCVCFTECIRQDCSAHYSIFPSCNQVKLLREKASLVQKSYDEGLWH